MSCTLQPGAPSPTVTVPVSAGSAVAGFGAGATTPGGGAGATTAGRWGVVPTAGGAAEWSLDEVIGSGEVERALATPTTNISTIAAPRTTASGRPSTVRVAGGASAPAAAPAGAGVARRRRGASAAGSAGRQGVQSSWS